MPYIIESNIDVRKVTVEKNDSVGLLSHGVKKLFDRLAPMADQSLN